MAHNINLNKLTNEYSFYSRKEKAWHGLGQVVQDAVTPFEALKLSHLDYIVDIGDNFVVVDTQNAMENGKMKSVSVYKPVPNSRATFRTDTKDVFGAVGSKYTIVQNGQFLDFVYDVFKRPDMFKANDVIVETAGALGLGEKVFVTVKLPSMAKLRDKGDDVAEQYILITSTHDGSGVFTAGITNVRVVCNNTLNMALPGLSNKVSFRHTKSIHDNLKEGARLFALAFDWTDKQRLIYSAMLDIQLAESAVIKYVSKIMVTPPQFAALNEHKFNISKVPDDLLSVKTKNRLRECITWIDQGAGQKEEDIRGSLYWTFQGFNGYLNNGMSFSDKEKRFNFLTEGQGAKLTQTAFNLALDIVHSNG